ncbi:hypothetical protein SALBM311S_04641 [Streptomyces alboniger]
MLRAVKRASSASSTSSAFHTAVAPTGTDTYTALQTMATWWNPSVSAASDEGELYGVPFIDTPAASSSTTVTDDAALGRPTGTRLRVVESRPEQRGSAPFAPAHEPTSSKERETPGALQAG